MSEKYATMIKNLGKNLSIDNLELNENKQCRLTHSDVTVDIFFEEENGEFLVYSVLGNAPAGAGKDYFVNILNVNLAGILMGSGSVGYDPDNNRLIYADHVPLAGLIPETFEKFIRRMINIVKAWRQQVQIEYTRQPNQVANDAVKA